MNPAPTKVFLDCEFTDFVDFKMISIGLVADTGEEFYAELNVDAKECSEFVQLAVLPLLGKYPGSVCEDIDQLGDRLRTWLEEFDERKLIVLYDYFPDYCLLMESLSGELPDNVVASNNIYGELDAHLQETFYSQPGVFRHHALWDAKANRYAYRREERQL